MHGMALTVTVRVVPGARRSEVLDTDADGVVRVRVAAPATEGKANAELIRTLAAHYGVRRRDVTIVAGERGRQKVVRIDEGAG